MTRNKKNKNIDGTHLEESALEQPKETFICKDNFLKRFWTINLYFKGLLQGPDEIDAVDIEY